MNPAGSAKANSLTPSLSHTPCWPSGAESVGLNLKAHKIPITKGKPGVGTDEIQADHESVMYQNSGRPWISCVSKFKSNYMIYKVI